VALRENPADETRSPELLVHEGGTRRSILELAPLELECMNTLWPLGEASVRDIQTGLAPTLPRAYTTIMTIMDRLAQKGIVVRRKAGRAYLYRPSLSADQARAHAVAQIVYGFFEGSADALAAHLSSGAAAVPVAVTSRTPRGARHIARPLARAAQAEVEPDVPPSRSLDATLL
jgi:predicted transcriptional regulator